VLRLGLVAESQIGKEEKDAAAQSLPQPPSKNKRWGHARQEGTNRGRRRDSCSSSILQMGQRAILLSFKWLAA